MRISRLHWSAPLASGSILTVDGDSGHYLSRVLRLRTGDTCHLFNEHDGEFVAVIQSVQRNTVELKLGQAVANQAESPLEIHLGLGLSRGERMDTAIQKATELGVFSITPLTTAHCEVRFSSPDRLENKLQHWRRIATHASEQCGRIRVPSVKTPDLLENWLKSNPDGLVLDPTANSRLESVKTNTSINLLVGPEGGFSEAELSVAHQHGYQSISLGPRILRTETAPLAALAILQYLFGDL